MVLDHASMKRVVTVSGTPPIGDFRIARGPHRDALGAFPTSADFGQLRLWKIFDSETPRRRENLKTSKLFLLGVSASQRQNPTHPGIDR
jgi:hypothetical protein